MPILRSCNHYTVLMRNDARGMAKVPSSFVVLLSPRGAIKEHTINIKSHAAVRPELARPEAPLSVSKGGSKGRRAGKSVGTRLAKQSRRSNSYSEVRPCRN